MARQKRGEPGYEESVTKWRKTMLEKYGGAEAFHEKMVKIGRKGGRNGRGPGYTGGFAGNRELARRAGKIGGTISRRGPARHKEE